MAFPYLHNYSKDLELKLNSIKDSVELSEPIEVSVSLINRSKTDTIFYEYFNKNYDFYLQDMEDKIYENIAKKYIIIDTVSKTKDQYGRTLNTLFHSKRFLCPKDTVELFNDELIFAFYFNEFVSGEYYLSAKIVHTEYDALWNPVETTIASNKIKFVVYTLTE